MNSPSDADGAPVSGAPNSAAHWRADITSLVFPLPEPGVICAVHRGAFRQHETSASA
ncbi:hypothetical protein [Bradyrhizobium embrapense]